jgi:hypothetical protein
MAIPSKHHHIAELHAIYLLYPLKGHVDKKIIYTGIISTNLGLSHPSFKSLVLKKKFFPAVADSGEVP